MRYFAGTDLGHVFALPAASFEELAESILQSDIVLPMTRPAFHALPLKERQAAKRVRYITPAAFKEPNAPRRNEHALYCNLIALDIDDAGEAARLLKQGFSEVLGELGYLVWYTASSLPEAPRLRVVVSAERIEIPRYAAAVRTIASMLGLEEPTRESMVPVQPMYLPTSFEGEPPTEMVAANKQGDAFSDDDITDATDKPIAASEPQDDSVKDITFLRSPLDDVGPAEAESALAVLDPDCAMGQWIEVGAALKHQFGEAGYQLWDAWSVKGKKYDADEMEGRWRSLRANPTDRAPVTMRSVFRLAKARGWANPILGTKTYQAQMEWLKNSVRSTEELIDQGCQRIATAAPTVDMLQRKALILTLRDRLNATGLPTLLNDLRRKVKNLELETAKTTGVPGWAKGLCLVTANNIFYRHTTDRRFSPEVIDLMYSTPQIGDEKPLRPRDYLVQVVGVPQVENMRYDPKQGSKRFFTEDEKPYVNIYRPSPTKANAEGAAAAGDLFQAHIGNLIREPEYQRTLIDFLCFHVQHPGQKIRWATVLQGGQGCGKSFIGAAMAAVLGRRNIRKLTANDVMEGNHNGWAYGQQIIILEEVRIAGANRYAVMDKLKPCISDDEISIRRLYEAHQTVPNSCNYLMFTNHHDSLAVRDDDRRYFVLSSPLQNAEDIAGLGGQPYFDTLFGMLRDNAGGLRSWMENWTISKKFSADGRAPVTPYLKQLADAAQSPLAAAVVIALEDEAHALVRRDLVSLTALRGAMNTEQMKGFSDQALAGVLRELGWSKVGRALIGDERHQLWTKGCKGDPVKVARMRLEFL